MKRPALILLALATTHIACSQVQSSQVQLSEAKFPQGHGSLKGEGIQSLSFLEGVWRGKQNFNTGGPEMIGDIVNQVSKAIGGRYLEEKLSTTISGRKPTDSRHFITFDPTTKEYRAWWFNDTSIGPTELVGKLTGRRLVLQSKPGERVLRASYDSPDSDHLNYKLELQAENGWRLLFTSVYSKSR